MSTYRYMRLANNKMRAGLVGMLLISLLAACGETPTITPAPLPTSDPRIIVPTTTPYPTRQIANANIPAFGTTYYYSLEKIKNIEAQDNFLAAYAQGKPGQWEAVQSGGGDGGQSSSLFIYKGTGKQFTVSVDATHISMARPEDMVVSEYTCQSISKTTAFINNAMHKFIDIKSCTAGKETSDWEIPLPLP